MRQLIFRKDYYIGIAALPEKLQLEAYTAIARYAFYGETPCGELSPELKPVLASIFYTIDMDIAKYERRMLRRAQESE